MACWKRLHLQFRPRWTSGRTSKSSNGRKIARMARNSTIFGPNESSRRDLFLEKFSKSRNNRKVFEKLRKIFEIFLYNSFFCLFARSFENFSKFSSRRRDRFGPKIVQFRPILAIFRPFENSTTEAIMGHLPLFATLFPRYLKGKGDH